MFSCIALRESKVFHLKKVISSKLALALLRLWTITDATLWLGACCVGWIESQCTFLAGRRWSQMLFQRQSYIEWGLSLYSEIAFLLSLPSSPAGNIFHRLHASSLNSEHFSQGIGFHLQHWAAFLLLWCHCFSLVPTPALRISASPGNDMGKALFLWIQKRQKSLWLYWKALPEKAC